jgi:ankyrin repeat protein
VFGAIERGEDAAELRAAVGSVPRERRAGEGGAGDAGPWLDRGGNDKRHLTPLMRAAKLGKAALVAALIDEHGAGVNVQAPRSAFTALHLAVFEGHAAAVEALLARGADAAMVNKWGESVRKVAADKRRPNILALLDRAEAQRGKA